jgi:hypothetical protein
MMEIIHYTNSIDYEPEVLSFSVFLSQLPQVVKCLGSLNSDFPNVHPHVGRVHGDISIRVLNNSFVYFSPIMFSVEAFSLYFSLLSKNVKMKVYKSNLTWCLLWL